MWKTDCILLSMLLILLCFFFKIKFFQKLNSLTFTAAGVEWNDVNMLHEELEMAGISTPRAHIPSSGVADVHPVDNVQPR